ncbi:hypothetical protein [Flavobacterium sp.]|jgi:hypothetical protein|uniref:hypothetical protein n=1 Tax=Flavobacterium sp. TaxID=239 RepID=UPI0037C0A4EA
MKKFLPLFFFSLLLVACKRSVSDSDIAKINGYWEIQKVELPQGGKKEYKINETIDFFAVKDNKGFRQKVMPQLDGTYLTNNIKENLTVTNKDGVFYVNYTTNFGKWQEEIVELKDSILVLKNKENLEYHYKRQIPFSIK